MEPIDLKFVEGDAREVSADVCVIGGRSPLVAWLSRKTGVTFRPIELAGPMPLAVAEGRLLSSARSPWLHTLAVDFTARRRVRQSAVATVACAVHGARASFPASRILILPLSCRHPDAVALSTVAAIYLEHVAAAGLSDQRSRVEYVLCDLADLSPFRRVLADDAGILRRWIDGAVSSVRAVLGPGPADIDPPVFTTGDL